MIGILGYNFCRDVDAMNPYPTHANTVQFTRVANAIYGYINITSNVANPYPNNEPPTGWQFDTIVNVDFDGDVSGGSSENVEDIIAVRIKRRIHGEFEWTTIKEFDITSSDQLKFTTTDNLGLNFTTYDYAFVPITTQGEGNYIIYESVLSEFNGVFICDQETIHKFEAGVEYGTNDYVQKIGTFEPYGRQYPVVISNGLINYQTGSLTGTILPVDYTSNGRLNRQEMVEIKKTLAAFLTNKRPKIIKDFNGNAWLIYIVDNVSIDYKNNWGMGIADITASWIETGNVDSKSDLYKNGLIPTEA